MHSDTDSSGMGGNDPSCRGYAKNSSLGFRDVKWIEAAEFVEGFEHLVSSQGGYNGNHEFYGYRQSI